MARAMSEVHIDLLTLVLMKIDDIDCCVIEVFKHQHQNIDANGILFYECFKTEVGEHLPNFIHHETIMMNIIEITSYVFEKGYVLTYSDDSIPRFRN